MGFPSLLAAPGLYVLHGRPVPKAGDLEDKHAVVHQEEPDNALRVLCNSLAKQARLLVIIDGVDTMAWEWGVLADACKLGVLTLFNTNLPSGVGYIRDHLLSSSNKWAEVHRWQETVLSDPKPSGSQTLARQFLSRRSASVLINERLC